MWPFDKSTNYNYEMVCDRQDPSMCYSLVVLLDSHFKGAPNVIHNHYGTNSNPKGISFSLSTTSW